MILPILGLSCILQMSSAVINCRIACRRCRENQDSPDMLEVYCAMCDECKERRREWLQGGPNLNLRLDENCGQNNMNMDYNDDCITPPPRESCEEPVMLTHRATTTTTTTTTPKTTTTEATTTTQRPCHSKPHCVRPRAVTPRPPCMAMPCPIPYAPMALCPMCPQMAPVNVESNTVYPGLKDIAGSSTTASAMFFYVGVPKKMLKDLHLRS